MNHHTPFSTPHFTMRPLAWATVLALATLSTAASAASIDIATTPVSKGSGVAPNLLYIHDDSTSMRWDYMPDGTTHDFAAYAPKPGETAQPWWGRCMGKINIHDCKNPAKNTIYYNPELTYEPPVRPNPSGDGTMISLGNSDFNNAWVNGYDLAGRDGTGNYPDDVNLKPWSKWPRRINLASPPANYQIYAGHYNGSALVPVVTAAERQNFANWFSYYSTRGLLAKGGISRAFADLDPNIRVGYGSICTGLGSRESCTTGGAKNYQDGSAVQIGAVRRGVRPFKDLTGHPVYGTQSFKTEFYNWLFGITQGDTNPTPLRAALDWSGQYYQNSTNIGPWANYPGIDKGPLSETASTCRKSYVLLMTDGYWDDADGAKSNSNLWSVMENKWWNIDNISYDVVPRHSAGPTYQYTYEEMNAFKDEWKGTLADIAMYYWSRDLVPVMENRVAPTKRDPGYWQHMNTLTVGLGVTPVGVDPEDAFARAETRPPLPVIPNYWPDPGHTNPAKITDQLHAAVNGHGYFMSAKNPQEFEDGIREALSQMIEGGRGAVGAMAANSTALTSETRLYSSVYDPAGWSGELKATALCTAVMVEKKQNGCTEVGAERPSGGWMASIPAHDARTILTWDGTASKAFTFATLSIAQRAALNNDAGLVDYLRGDTSKEGNPYRRRQGALGDIVNSGILYADPGVDNHGWIRAASVVPAQRQAYQTRMVNALEAAGTPEHKRTVFVGANDGMLHAFNADTGVERFAYVPNAAYEHLKKLADANYTHRYFVDGTPISGDIDLGEGTTSPNWHSLVVTSTGAGGRAYFALDVENVNSPTALWEVSGGGADVSAFPATAGFEALGVAIGRAAIVRTNDTDNPWVTIFGNGYNSRADAGDRKSQQARLFIVNARTGALVRQISTGVGSDDAPNGLATPLLVDYDGNGAADAAYAGDLQGNLWKFDLSGASSTWNVAFAGKPLLKATDASGKPQPITAQPEAMRRKGHAGEVMVYVGTGRYFAVDDPEDMSLQSLYGVADPCGNTATCAATPTNPADTSLYTRANLTGQTLSAGSVGTAETRTLSQNPQAAPGDKGFYVDLSVGGMREGERVIANALMYYDRVYFVTLLPGGTSDSCNSSNSSDSWLYAIDPWQGGALDFSVFGESYGNVSGVKIPGGSGTGIVPIGERVYTDPDSNFKNQGNISYGRRTWRSLR